MTTDKIWNLSVVIWYKFMLGGNWQITDFVTPICINWQNLFFVSWSTMKLPVNSDSLCSFSCFQRESDRIFRNQWPDQREQSILAEMGIQAWNNL
jgi:hypothetical protein